MRNQLRYQLLVTNSPEINTSDPKTRSRSRRLAVLAESALKRLHIRDRVRQGVAHAALGVSAAILAYVPPSLLGLREGFWAAISALAITQTQFTTAFNMGRDQMLGAMIGGAAGALTAALVGKGLAAYGLAVCVAILAAWLANAGTAARLASITTTIIILVPHQTSDTYMLISRVSEVFWGVLSALAVVKIAQAIAFGRTNRP